MKKIILLSALTSSMLLATNGDLMMGHGAKATAMGGVGIAVSHGAESAYSNPAMLKDVKSSEFDASVTMFMPDVNFKSSLAGANAAFEQSDADRSFIPEMSYVHRNNDHVVWGIALGGTAGMGVDYVGKNSSGASNMKTELQILKLGVPVAYTNDNLTIAVEPVLQYSSLQMNYTYQTGATTFANSDNPKSSSTGLGVNFGAAYEVGDLTIGALYQSKIEAEYDSNVGTAMGHFRVGSVTSGDRLDQPAEMGVGVAYKFGNSTLGLDVKKIKWSRAKGYEDFGWDDQNVIALGYQYQAPTWALRAGYNHAKSPISELDGNTGDGAKINFFNLAGFPAMVETHYTLGGEYSVSDNVALTLAAVYTPEESNKYNITGMTGTAGSTAEVKHSQQALTVGASYKF